MMWPPNSDYPEPYKKLPALSRQGYRQFHCEDCGITWEEATRDYMSPSGEDCPKCWMWIHPEGRRPAPWLPIDEMGNLKDNRERKVIYLPGERTT